MNITAGDALLIIAAIVAVVCSYLVMMAGKRKDSYDVDENEPTDTEDLHYVGVDKEVLNPEMYN